MPSAQESLADLRLRAEKALQHFRLLSCQNYIHVACKRALEDQLRITRRASYRERARLLRRVQQAASLLPALRSRKAYSTSLKSSDGSPIPAASQNPTS